MYREFYIEETISIYFPHENLVNFIVRYLWTKDGKYAGGRWNFVFKGSILSYVVVVIYLRSLNSFP